MERPLVVAIDGPAGAGKSAVARELARRLGIPYLDTGAMYRAVGVAAAAAGHTIPPRTAEDEVALAVLAAEVAFAPGAGWGELVATWRDRDLGESLRSPEASKLASVVSAVSPVRRELVRQQRELIRRFGGGVVEGRDIGTVVFPDATIKVFLTANPEERARRRWKELAQRGLHLDLDVVLQEQHERDLRDSTRADSPLRPAPAAEVVDTSALSLDQVVERLLALVGARMEQR